VDRRSEVLESGIRPRLRCEPHTSATTTNTTATVMAVGAWALQHYCYS